MRPDPPEHSDTMNTQLITLGFSSEDERPTNLRLGLAWGTRYECCAMSAAIARTELKVGIFAQWAMVDQAHEGLCYQ